jgi:hypothetical protein
MMITDHVYTTETDHTTHIYPTNTNLADLFMLSKLRMDQQVLRKVNFRAFLHCF